MRKFTPLSEILKNVDLPIADFQNLGKCESPIETRLAKALRFWGVVVQVQRPIGPYRADIYIEMDGKKIVVECDGVDYHSSYEQREHDHKRDKYMEEKGYMVIRFTGSAINKRLEECIIRVIEELSSIYPHKQFQDWLYDYLKPKPKEEEEGLDDYI